MSKPGILASVRRASAGGVALENSAVGAVIDTSLTLSGFTVSGTNRYLLVSVANANNGYTIAVTYGGVSMTLLDDAANPSGAQRKSTLFGMVNPTSGSANVVVTSSSADGLVAVATCWSGVDQSTPLGTIAKATGSSTTPSVNVSSGAGEVVVDAVSARSTNVLTVGASQTQIEHGLAGSNLRGASSSEDGAGTTTMSWSYSPSDVWATIAVPIKPA